MIRVCTEYLLPGMILAKKVPGVDGGTFLESGVQLGEKQIDLLKEFGPIAVFVRLPVEMDIETETFRQAERHVRNFFMYVDPDHEAFRELFSIAVRRTAQALRADWEMPCESALRAKNVEHLSDVFIKDLGTAEQLVRHEVGLASFPDIYFKIREVLDNPKSSARDIAEVVNTDVGFSAKLLKLVNSPFFGFTATIDSVSRAVSLVGAQEISTLALGISTINYFKNIPSELMDMRTFWRHSLRCAVFAKLIASKLKLPSERHFTAGLLHDVGRLIIFKNMAYASVEALLLARADMVPQVEAETMILEYNHADVGDLLLAEWGFPPALKDLIAHHHAPEHAASRKEAAVIQLADIMANIAEISAGGLYALPGMTQEDWRLLGLNLQDLSSLMELHDAHFEEITTALL
ncbi:HDOD domain-containing protein [Desulfonatronum thioautotrophicum]|uniref:HDOD domain-containing protein n=1 Tax=Desulfonatronum thioautotrophicum TaxID=617001 RepID=UPI0005EB3366|nr:HDOD domain-containing protein [Desulfonatronum thioautotrophicum]